MAASSIFLSGEPQLREIPLAAFEARNAVQPDETTFCHTNPGEANAWWEVDLGGSYKIGRFEILNRKDGGQARLNDIWVFLSPAALPNALATAQTAAAWSYRSQNTNPVVVSMTVPDNVPNCRYLRIQLNSGDALNMARVRVWEQFVDQDILETSAKVLVARRNALLAWKGSAKLEIPVGNILVVGASQAGKSSIINTICTTMKQVAQGAMNSAIQRIALSMGASTSVTKQLTRFDLTPWGFQMALWDTAGWTAQPATEITVQLLLQGALPSGWQLDRQPNIMKADPGVSLNPEKEKAMHSVLLVVPAPEAEQDAYYSRFQAYVSQAGLLGCKVSAVLTKIDAVDPNVARNPEGAYASKLVMKKREAVAQRTGLSVSEVIPMKNYTTETQATVGMHALTLTLLEHLVDQVQAYVDASILRQ